MGTNINVHMRIVLSCYWSWASTLAVVNKLPQYIQRYYKYILSMEGFFILSLVQIGLQLGLQLGLRKMMRVK